MQVVSGSSSQINQTTRIIAFPRWRGLYHFTHGVMGVTFSDGSTFEDLSKVFL